MAGASLNDIKARMRSVTGTMQITKAMELVATSKLRRAKVRAETAAAYQKSLAEVLAALQTSQVPEDLVWFANGDAEGKKTLLIAVAGDRGLAGGFNSMIFRTAAALTSQKEDVVVLPIGKKAADHFRYRGAELYEEDLRSAAEFGVGPAMETAKKICEDFENGKIGKVILVYTEFVSMMTQRPKYEVLLPLKTPEEKPTDPVVDGDVTETFASVLRDLIGGEIYAAVAQSLASESAARRSAMNSANKNAAEMIDDLGLKYNRARQAVITQEITEIVSGAEAL